MHAAEGDLAAAVVDLEEQRFRAQRHIHRFEDHHVGGELDPAVRVQGRAVDIEYGPVSFQGRIDFEPGAPGQFFIGSGGAECHPVRNDFTFRNFEFDQLCFCADREEEADGKQECGQCAEVLHGHLSEWLICRSHAAGVAGALQYRRTVFRARRTWA